MIFRRHRMPGVIEWFVLVIPALIGLIREGMPENVHVLWFWWVPGLMLLSMLGFVASLCNMLVSSPYRMPWRNIFIRPGDSFFEWFVLLSAGYALAPEMFTEPTPEEGKDIEPTIPT